MEKFSSWYVKWEEGNYIFGTWRAFWEWKNLGLGMLSERKKETIYLVYGGHFGNEKI